MAMMRWRDMSLLEQLNWEAANRPFNRKSARAIRNKYTSKGPDNQLTKGFVKKLKKFNPNFRNAARSEQKASHKLDRRASKKQIELGLLDYELEQEAQAYEEAEFLYEIGIDYSLGDDHTAFYTVAKAADDYMLLAEPTHLKGVHCDSIIVDELQPMWQYKHEGD